MQILGKYHPFLELVHFRHAPTPTRCNFSACIFTLDSKIKPSLKILSRSVKKVLALLIMLMMAKKGDNARNVIVCISFSAAVAEMLVQSTGKDLYLLPAIPRDKWANGCIKGLKARGGLTVNICWREGDLHEVGLWVKDHNNSTTVRQLHYRSMTTTVKILPGKVYTFSKKLKCVKITNLL